MNHLSLKINFCYRETLPCFFKRKKSVGIVVCYDSLFSIHVCQVEKKVIELPTLPRSSSASIELIEIHYVDQSKI